MVERYSGHSADFVGRRKFVCCAHSVVIVIFADVLCCRLTGVTSFSHLINLEHLDISRNDIDSLQRQFSLYITV